MGNTTPPRLELAYLGFAVSDTAAWNALLVDVVGLTPNGTNPDGSLAYRMDSYRQRVFLERGDADDIVATGFVAMDRSDYDAIRGRIAQTGTRVEIGSRALADNRHVEELVTFSDPFGNMLELGLGHATDPQPFRSAVAPSGFVTDDMGLGHVVLLVTDLDEGVRWYQEALGLRLSDTASEQWGELEPKAAFMNCNRRHHSLGLAAGIPSLKRAIHVEFHVPSIDDVGTAFDRAQASGVTIVRTLGRHPDGVLSFYAQTPSGFEWEIGTGGFDVDANWKNKHFETFSLWGHKPPVPATSPSQPAAKSGREREL